LDAKDLSHLASWLVEKRNDEASLRTAISRIYYAAHLVAVRKLREKGWEPTGKGDDHGRVIHELRGRRYRNLADKLQRLRAFREHADYHLEAADSVLNTGCEFCKKLRQSPVTSGMVTTLSHWQEAKEISERLFPLLEKL
jgi:hypothetical protein